MKDLGIKEKTYPIKKREYQDWNNKVFKKENLIKINNLMESLDGLGAERQSFKDERIKLLNECKQEFRIVDLTDDRQSKFLKQYLDLCKNRLQDIEAKHTENLKMICYCLTKEKNYDWLKREIAKLSNIERNQLRIENAKEPEGFNETLTKDCKRTFKEHRDQLKEKLSNRNHHNDEHLKRYYSETIPEYYAEDKLWQVQGITIQEFYKVS